MLPRPVSNGMKAVILAAGEGKRLRPLTFGKPKQLIEALGKPLIQYIWEALPDAVDEVVIVIGYRGQMIREFLGDEYMGKRVTYIEQPEPLGTAYALKLCRSHLEHEGRFFLIYGDDIQVRSSFEKCLAHDSALLASPVEDPRRFGVVVVDENGVISDIEEKPENPKTNLAVAGAYLLTPQIFDYDTEQLLNGEYYLTDMIAAYIKDRPVQMVESDLWIPIGFPDDITRAEQLLREFADQQLR